MSWKPVPPPVWARETESVHTAVFVPSAETVPPTLTSNELDLGRCRRCGASGRRGVEVKLVKSTVYTSTGAFERLVETRPCSACPPNRRSQAGPDLSEFSLFNLDNTHIFSHELLNEYSSRFTLAELPFDAFVRSLGRTYKERGCALAPCTKRDFRWAWFAFCRVQSFPHALGCKECGDKPEVIIADGVSAGFPRSQVTASLNPPTIPSSCSTVRNNVRSLTDFHRLVPGRSLRKSALALLQKSGEGRVDSSGADFQLVAQQLKAIRSSLFELFKKTVCENLDASRARVYRVLVSQVS